MARRPRGKPHPNGHERLNQLLADGDYPDLFMDRLLKLVYRARWTTSGCIVIAPSSGGSIEGCPQCRSESESDSISRIDLYLAVLRLPELEQALIWLRYFESFSCKQIAERFRLTAGAVASRLRRAQKRIRTQMIDLEIGDWAGETPAPRASKLCVNSTLLQPQGSPTKPNLWRNYASPN